MEKKLKYLVQNLKNVFSLSQINKIAKTSKFVQRQSGITTKDFLIFNAFYGDNICGISLSQLASKYA